MTFKVVPNFSLEEEDGGPESAAVPDACTRLPNLSQGLGSRRSSEALRLKPPL